MKENILFIQGIYDTIDLFIADLSTVFKKLENLIKREVLQNRKEEQ